MTRLRLIDSYKKISQIFTFTVIICSILVAVAAEDKAKAELIKNEAPPPPESTTTSAPPALASTSTSAPVTVTPPPVAATIPQLPINLLQQLQLAALPAFKVEAPQTLTDFIRSMMKKYGEVKAAEAFQSLDQLPLGLIMKVLLVEVDKPLAADIVEMQRYAQSSDKALITMIGRIVAGDKNVPKEIFTMDQKLLKFPWWARIRQRMFANLEKYVAAYSLVPVAAKTAVNTGSRSSANGLLADAAAATAGLPNSELTLAVAASATESSNPSQEKVHKKPTVLTPADAVKEPAVASSSVVESPENPLKLSLLNPIQQQEILETLALAKAAADTNAQARQLHQFQQQQQQQQQTQQSFNPFAFLLG